MIYNTVYWNPTIIKKAYSYSDAVGKEVRRIFECFRDPNLTEGCKISNKWHSIKGHDNIYSLSLKNIEQELKGAHRLLVSVKDNRFSDADYVFLRYIDDHDYKKALTSINKTTANYNSFDDLKSNNQMAIDEAINDKSVFYRDPFKMLIPPLSEDQKNNIRDFKSGAFLGVAGSGKTLVAIDLYRKKILENKPVIFVTYNEQFKYLIRLQLGAVFSEEHIHVFTMDELMKNDNLPYFVEEVIVKEIERTFNTKSPEVIQKTLSIFRGSLIGYYSQINLATSDLSESDIKKAFKNQHLELSEDDILHYLSVYNKYGKRIRESLLQYIINQDLRSYSTDIIVDECQDFSSLELAYLIKKSGSGDVCFFGDTYQTIVPTVFKPSYIAQGLTEIRKWDIDKKTIEKNLTHSYRYGPKITSLLRNLINVRKNYFQNTNAKYNIISKSNIVDHNPLLVFLEQEDSLMMDSFLELVEGHLEIVIIFISEIEKQKFISSHKLDNKLFREFHYLTIVEAKGQEFDIVFLYRFFSSQLNIFRNLKTNMNNSYFDEIVFNTLFVGSSRAKKQLVYLEEEKVEKTFKLFIKTSVETNLNHIVEFILSNFGKSNEASYSQAIQEYEENNLKKALEYFYSTSERIDDSLTKIIEIQEKLFGKDYGDFIATPYNEYKINETNKPKKDNFAFIGWYFDLGLTMPVSLPLEVTKSTILYALWGKSVKIADNNYEKTILLRQNTLFRLQEVDREGYFTKGIYLDKQKSKPLIAPFFVNDNVTLYCDFIKYYKIEFLDDLTKKTKTFLVEDGNYAPFPSVEEEEQYEFLGWFDKDTRHTKPFIPRKNTDLISKRKKKHSVTLIYDNPNTGKVLNMYYLKDKEFLNENEVKIIPGYHFDGWYVDNKLVQFPLKIEADIELIARWRKIHQLSIDYKHPLIRNKTITKLDKEVLDSILVPKVKGVDYYEWYEAEKKIKFPLVINRDYNIYGIWKKMQPGHVVRLTKKLK